MWVKRNSKTVFLDLSEYFLNFGFIKEEDLKVTLRALGIEPTSNKIKKLIERVNVGVSGLLSRENYEAMMLHLIHDIDSDEQMVKSFQLFANQESGDINLDDLKSISKQLEMNVTDEELQEMIAIADHDQDGKVTQNEFLDIARKIF